MRAQLMLFVSVEHVMIKHTSPSVLQSCRRYLLKIDANLRRRTYALLYCPVDETMPPIRPICTGKMNSPLTRLQVPFESGRKAWSVHGPRAFGEGISGPRMVQLIECQHCTPYELSD